MFRKKIIYRLFGVFLIFSVMLVVPLSLSVVVKVNHMIADDQERGIFLRDFIPGLMEQIVPFVFYVLALSFLLSFLFLRKMLFPLRQLQNGSRSLRDGNLDIELDVTSSDELGDAIRAFNEMAASLRNTSKELQRNEIYINAMLDPLWVLSEDKAVLDINPAFTRLFGYAKEDISGRSLDVLFDVINATLFKKHLEDKKEKDIASTCEVTVRTRDGQDVPVLISSSPICSGGSVVGTIGILKDFREQNSLRAELKRSKEYVETIMDSLEDHLMVIDSDYKVIMANKVAVAASSNRIIGAFCYSAAYGLSKPCWSAGQECPARTVFLTGKGSRATRKYAPFDGEVRYREVTASPIRDISGQVVNVIEVARDVTDRMKYEEEIFRKNRELIVLNSVAGLLGESLRPQEIFLKVLDKAVEMMGMDGGGLFFLDDTGKELYCKYHRGISDEFAKIMGRIRVGEDIPGRVAATGQIIATPDLPRDQLIERSMIKHTGIKGYCCIPLRGKEKITGVFCLFSFTVRDFSEDEQSILASIGKMTGITLENVRLYEQMKALYEHQKKRKEEEQTQLLRLSNRLGSGVALEDAEENVLHLMKSFFHADFIWLLVEDKEGNLVQKSCFPFSGQSYQIIYPKGVSSIEGYSVEMKRLVVIQDLRAEGKFYIPDEVSRMSYQSAVAVPMTIGGKTVGVFGLYYQAVREFGEEEQDFLKIIVNMLAVYLERSEYYDRAIMEKGRSETILQSVADGIITVDVKGRTIAVNRAFENMTGIPSREAVGLPICDALRYSDVNVDFRLSLADCLEDALEGRRSDRESVFATAFGNEIPLMISSAPIIDSGGHITGVVNLLRDISREKEIDRMKTEIIRSVSHEFRTPLSAIVGMTEMLLEEDLEEAKKKKYLNTILSEGIRLSIMVSDLLSIARMESGKEHFKLGRIGTRALMDGLIQAFGTIIQKKKANVGYDVLGAEYLVGDEERIRQMLMILIDNALLFSDSGCTIEIKVRRTDDAFEIIVSDTGWGIPEEDLPRLSERFFRGKHGEKIKGTGLGLSLCKEIVGMHDGKMVIESRFGQGTCVTVTLPCKEVD